MAKPPNFPPPRPLMGRNDNEQALIDSLRSYLHPFDEQLLGKGFSWLDWASRQPTETRSSDNYGDPLELALVLAENRQPLETVVAALIYGSARSRNSLPLIHEVQKEFGSIITHIVRDAGNLAEIHRPKIGPKLWEKIERDENRHREQQEEYHRRKAEAGKKILDRAEKEGWAHAEITKQVQRAKAKIKSPKKTVLQEWSDNYLDYIQSLDVHPAASTIRVAERYLLLRDIDVANPTKLDRERLNETVDVQGRLALTLGMGKISDFFNDLHLKVTQPDVYKEIVECLNILDHATNFSTGKDAIDSMRTALTELGLEERRDFVIKRRMKKPASIYRKLVSDGIDIDGLFRPPVGMSDEERRRFVHDSRVSFIREVLGSHMIDAFGTRIIVDPEALQVRGLIRNEGLDGKELSPEKEKTRLAREAVYFMRDLAHGILGEGETGSTHSLHIADRDKDYINQPKKNGYRSYHVCVASRADIPRLGLEGQQVFGEWQIRTFDQDFEAENGVWAHNSFKAGGTLAEAAFRTEAARIKKKESVFCFTPEGEIIKLPIGATVRDLAFRINRTIGVLCQSARLTRGYRDWRNPDKYSEENSTFLLPGDRLETGTYAITFDQTIPESRLPAHVRQHHYALEREVTTTLARDAMNKIVDRPVKKAAANDSQPERSEPKRNDPMWRPAPIPRAEK